MSCCDKCAKSGGSCAGDKLGAFQYNPVQGKRFVSIPPPQLITGGQFLSPGQKLVSKNGAFAAVFQTDGNFVCYALKGNGYYSKYVDFASNTVNSGAVRAVMQNDGNFVLYDTKGRAVWATQSNGPIGSYYIIMQNDGNLVIYSNGSSVWSMFEALGLGPGTNFLGRIGDPMSDPTTSTTTTPSPTSYIITGVAAFALGLLGATLIERHC